MVYPIGVLFRPVVNSFVKKVEGLENLPKNRAFVIASNHNSLIDPFILGGVITKYIKKRKIYFISAMFFFFELLVAILFGEFVGSIRLKKKVHGGFLNSAIRQLRKGNIVGIFPEGIPNKKPDIREGKTGVARLVLNGKVPVVPIGIKGTLYLWSRLRWFPRINNKVTVRIGKPLSFDKYYDKEYDYNTLKKVTRVIMKDIASLAEQEYNF